MCFKTQRIRWVQNQVLDIDYVKNIIKIEYSKFVSWMEWGVRIAGNVSFFFPVQLPSSAMKGSTIWASAGIHTTRLKIRDFRKDEIFWTLPVDKLNVF